VMIENGINTSEQEHDSEKVLNQRSAVISAVLFKRGVFQVSILKKPTFHTKQKTIDRNENDKGRLLHNINDIMKCTGGLKLPNYNTVMYYMRQKNDLDYHLHKDAKLVRHLKDWDETTIVPWDGDELLDSLLDPDLYSSFPPAPPTPLRPASKKSKQIGILDKFELSTENEVVYVDITASTNSETLSVVYGALISALKLDVASPMLVQENLLLRQEGKPMSEGYTTGKSQRLIINIKTTRLDGTVKPFVHHFNDLIKETCRRNPHARQMYSKLTGGNMCAKVLGVQEVMGIVFDRFGTRETFVTRQTKHRDKTEPQQQILVVMDINGKDLRTEVESHGEYKVANTPHYWFDPFVMHGGGEDRSMVGTDHYPYAAAGRVFFLLVSDQLSAAELLQMQEFDGAQASHHWVIDLSAEF
jgi:hypothetical protein